MAFDLDIRQGESEQITVENVTYFEVGEGWVYVQTENEGNEQIPGEVLGGSC